MEEKALKNFFSSTNCSVSFVSHSNVGKTKFRECEKIYKNKGSDRNMEECNVFIKGNPKGLCAYVKKLYLI